MENAWIFYALGGLLALGLGDFIKKVVISKGINKEVFLLVCFSLYVIIFWTNMYFQGSGGMTIMTLQSGILLGINNAFTVLGLMISLKYLETSFAMVSMRLISSIMILFIGIYWLGDNISFYNIIGFVLGAFAIFLLSGFSFNKKLQLPFKGVIGLVLATSGIIFGQAYFKYIITDMNVHDFMPIQFTTTFLMLLLYVIIRGKVRSISKVEIYRSFPYAFITMIIFVIHFLYLLPNIYLLGPLSLGYKILSYSLVIPILFSIIFLGDPIDKKRIFAFTLTIISIFLFLI